MKIIIEMSGFLSRQMNNQPKYTGLVSDLLPNVRLMQTFGHFIFRFASGPVLIRKVYSSVHMFLVIFQFVGLLINLAQNTDEVTELTCKRTEINEIHGVPD